jgi:hypothetical protein
MPGRRQAGRCRSGLEKCREERLKTIARAARLPGAISVRSLLAICLLCPAIAGHAQPRRLFPLSFDPHEKSSLAIANVKSLRGARFSLPLSPQREHDARPRFEISGKRLRFRLPF